MNGNRYRVGFNNTYIEFELIGNEITNLWELALMQGNELELPLFIYSFTPFYSADYNVDTTSLIEYVNLINQAIEGVNSSIDGVKFPSRAFTGMGFAQTNKLHRFFTTGKQTQKSWEHQIPHTSLVNFKNGNDYVGLTKYQLLNQYSPKQFKVIDKHLFLENLHKVNKYVHLYEDLTSKNNRRSKIFKKSFQKPSYEISWDHFDTSGKQQHPHSITLTPDIVQSCFVEDYYDYDIFLGKAITGKDYETCYLQYDNPLEWDITNVEVVSGNLRLYSKETLNLFKSSQFTEWCDDYEIQKHAFTPIPIGKIVESTEDFSSFKNSFSGNDTYTNGVPKPTGNFSNIFIKKVVNLI